MGIFSTILDKLGIKKPATTTATTTKTAIPSTTVKQPIPQTAAKSVAIPMVDVVSKLDKLAKANPQKLDWKVSIVDLLKLLGIDSGLDARKELAKELGCPADLIGGDYSKMNVWLHKTVMQKLAEHGGNIPKELLS